MDSSTLEAFFALLRSGLYGTPIEEGKVSQSTDWQQIIAIAKKQTVMGLIFDAVSRLPQDMQPPKETRDAMLRQSLLIMNTHALLDSTLAKVVDFYRSKGIEGVLLKGQGIARCYRSAQLRQCGDIDLYIGKENYQRSVDLAQESLDSHQTRASESEKHFHFNIGKVTVELHRKAALLHTPILNRKFENWMVAQLSDPSQQKKHVINGVDVYVPSATFNAFFIFYHAWYHYYGGGIGLRQLCDWTMVLHTCKDEIDRNVLEQTLSKFGLLKAWQLFAHIAVRQLGLPREEMPLYQDEEPKKYKIVFQKVLDGGNFGFHDVNRPTQSISRMPLLKRKAYLLGQMVKSYGTIASIMPVESVFYVVKTLGVASVNTVKQFVKHGNKSLAESREE